MSLTQIELRFLNNLDAIIRWCREHGLIAEAMRCPLCTKPCMQGLAHKGQRIVSAIKHCQGVPTNNIEAMWCPAKANIKIMVGSISHKMIPDYLSELMWVQHFREHRFFHFWSEVVSSCLTSVYKMRAYVVFQLILTY